MQGEDLTREQRDAAQTDLLRFTALNALSFEVLAGQILILFARNVGASLAEVGLLAALLPFASIIQLGVAPLVTLIFGAVTGLAVIASSLWFGPCSAANGWPAFGRPAGRKAMPCTLRWP